MKLDNRTFIVVLLITILLVVAGYLSSRIVFEEDISKLIPSDSRQSKLNSILKNSGYLDQLVVSVSLNDSTKDANPDALILIASKIIDSLQAGDSTRLIKEITYMIDDKTINNIMSEIYNNLPVFLDSSDYKAIDSALSAEAISHSIERTYKLLISPAGILVGKTLVRDPLVISMLALKKLQNLRLSDSYIIYNGYIFTPNKKNLLFFVSPTYPSSETNKNTILLNDINNKIDSINKISGKEYQIEYYGSLAITIDNSNQIKKDVIITVILSILLLIIFITYFVRIRWAAILTFLPAVFGAIISLATIYLIRGKISSISLGVGSILLGIGVDYALYILSQIDDKSSLKKILHKLWYSIILCSLTTAAVFCCLLFVKTEALRDLGLFMAISIMAAALFSILIMPYLFSLLRIKEVSTLGTSEIKFVKYLSSYQFDRNKWIISGALILTVILSITANRVDFDSDMTKMSFLSDKLKNAEKNIKRITNFSLENLIVISSGKDLDEALTNNDVAVGKLNSLKENGMIKELSTISAFIPSSGEQLKRIARWNSFWTLDRKIQIKKTFLIDSKSFRFNSNTFNPFFWTLDKEYSPLSKESLSLFRSSIMGNWIFELDSNIYIMNICKLDAAAKPKVSANLIGLNNVFVSDRQSIIANLITTMRIDFNFLINMSSLFVLIILIIALGRIELGVITFIPIIISWIWTKGIMGLVGEHFTIFNIIIATLIFGTGVDYCILIMRALQEEYVTGRNVLKYYKSGIFLSSATTIISVGVLYFAKHPALRSIALLPIAGFISVVFLTFTIEPIMVRWLMLKRKDIRSFPITIISILQTTVAYIYFILGCFLLFGLGTTLFSPLPLSKKRKKKIYSGIMTLFCISITGMMPNIKKRILNPNMENFEKPAVVICNHQSVMDILMLISQSPKIILLTNNWVWNSPLFGRVVRFAGFCPIKDGIESCLPQLEMKVKDGFSIVVFPEGTRSKDGKIARFHKGAFYLAQKLKIDILPLIIHGACDVIKKGEFLLRSGTITLKYLDRIPANDNLLTENTSSLAKRACTQIRNEYALLEEKIGTPFYYKDRLIKNYIYKKTTLEWYLRTKLKVEKNYQDVINNIPRNAVVTDLGCGYGFLSYLLYFTSNDRKILAVDHDKDKIVLANNCFSKNDNIEFICADINNYEIEKSDAIILFDLLHYLSDQDQRQLLVKCFRALNDNGIILIRDANSYKKRRHLVSKSIVRFLIGFGFNKSNNKLSFLPKDFLNEISYTNGFKLISIESSSMNSNELYLLKREAVRFQ